VIVGAGAVGSYLAERLAFEGQDVVVIEADPQRARELQASVDCLVITANGASIQALEDARVADAELMIAVTSSDAVNVLASQAAARLGVPKRVARVQDPTLREDLEAHGVDIVIDPVEALANELLLLVGRGGASEVVEFADGKINLFGGYVHAGSLLDGISLRELRGRVTGWEWIVGAVVRNGHTFIARGDSQIEVGDHVLIMANGDAAHEALELMGVDEHKAKKVFILGSTRLAVLTAENLVRAGISTVLVDIEANGCDELSAKYDRLVVVKGDPTDINVLKSEGIETADIVIGATGWDEVNVLGCLVAKALGAETTVARCLAAGRQRDRCGSLHSSGGSQRDIAPHTPRSDLQRGHLPGHHRRGDRVPGRRRVGGHRADPAQHRSTQVGHRGRHCAGEGCLHSSRHH